MNYILNKVGYIGCNPLKITRFDRIGKEVILYDKLGGTAELFVPIGDELLLNAQLAQSVERTAVNR